MWWQQKIAKKIDALEANGQYWKAIAQNDSLKLGKEQIKCVLDTTERDYLHLKERYKHDENKRLELAMDWSEYTEALNELSYAADLLDVDMEPNAYVRYDEKVKKPHIKRHEIERRFQEVLGDTLIDRWDECGKKNSPSS